MNENDTNKKSSHVIFFQVLATRRCPKTGMTRKSRWLTTTMMMMMMTPVCWRGAGVDDLEGLHDPRRGGQCRSLPPKTQTPTLVPWRWQLVDEVVSSAAHIIEPRGPICFDNGLESRAQILSTKHKKVRKHKDINVL